MPTGTIVSTANVGGISMASAISRTDDGQIGHEVSLPAGSAGTLTTRTDDNTGEATLSAGHGLSEGDVVDVYWADGVRYGMDVGVVAGNVVPIDGGAGDNLPDADSALVVTKQVTIDTDFDGDLVALIAALATQRAHLDFQTAGGVSLSAVELQANELWSWYSDSGIANPLTGDPVGSVEASCGTTAAAATLKLGALYSSA